MCRYAKRFLANAISIHALREESDLFVVKQLVRAAISIHALREESDQARTPRTNRGVEFQSTLSVRRATVSSRIDTTAIKKISIHALREESDSPVALSYLALILFQSTLSVRRATNDF